MNHIIKKVTLVVSAFALLASLVGCASFQKQKAFREYVSNLGKDQMTMKAFTISTNQLSTETDYKKFLSGLNTSIGYLDTLIASAETRNANISDSEIKDMDDSYVQTLKDMKSSFKMLYEGIDEQDEKKINLGKKQMESAANNVKAFATKMKNYADKYNMGNEKEFEEIEELLNSF